jgi:beta-phosphoglucomutase
MIILPEQVRITSVIFDFDGVIVDTEPLHYKAFQQLLEPMNLGYSWDEYVARYMGFDDRDAFVEAFCSRGRDIGQSELNELIGRKAQVFQDVIRDGVTAYAGVVEVIMRLHRRHVPLAICSGALRSDIYPILETVGIADCFSLVVTAEDVKRSKPDPECYLCAFESLRNRYPAQNLSPAGTLAIEDTPAGIQSALGAGLNVMAVTNSYPRTDLSHADWIVDSLEELEQYIQP